MFGLGLSELIVIFLVVFLLFGAKALPEIAKGLGQAMKIFRKEAQEIKEGFNADSAKGENKAEQKGEASGDLNPSAKSGDGPQTTPSEKKEA